LTKARFGGPSLFMRLRRSKPVDDRVPALEQRIQHLEAMIEGLQDAIHRESLRTNNKLEEMRKRLEPAELTRAISREERRRGL
jgi:uncharacterized coiled-coil protein SlyX